MSVVKADVVETIAICRVEITKLYLATLALLMVVVILFKPHDKGIASK